MYYKNRYQLQNDNTDGHSLPGDHVMVSPSPVKEAITLNLNGYSCVQDKADRHSNSFVFKVPPHISKRANNYKVINLNSNKTSYVSISNNDPKVNITHPDNINNKCYNYNSCNSKNNKNINTDNRHNDHVSNNIDIKKNDLHTCLYKKKGFHIAFLNVQHLLPKFDDIKLLLKDNKDLELTTDPAPPGTIIFLYLMVCSIQKIIIPKSCWALRSYGPLEYVTTSNIVIFCFCIFNTKTSMYQVI